MNSPCRILVLISGNGSNLQAIIDSVQSGQINGKLVAVFSNKADAYGLKRAELAGIPGEVIPYADFNDRQKYDQALVKAIDTYQPDLIVLAGFMRILTDEFVNHYAGRMLNIHPSLLPKYKGLNTHKRVLDAGEKEHGASVHFVVPELDSGPVILQGKISIAENETEQQLIERIHEIEHKIYPKAVRWFADRRLALSKGIVLFDNKPLTQPKLL
ncbi:MAG: phosphoribosylglycinamide formyltransferase [Gammaproteobacteria bacterium]|nr:phosphoribosylglycinamide formyltransferase [Gammaproteobacteria bacterium]